MLLLILATCLAQAPVFEGDPALAELLRDAQVSNRESLRAGKITGRLENRFRGPEGAGTMRVQFEVWWDGPRSFSKLKFRDNGQQFTARVIGHDYSGEEPEWEYILRTDNRCYVYNYVPQLVAVYDGKKFSTGKIEVNPWDSWFYCRPPYGSGGTLWLDQIGSVKEPGKTISRFRIERSGTDLIRQVRQDPGGGVNETVFSMAACGNVVETSYQAGNPENPSMKGIYAWRTLPGGPCVLDGWKFSSTEMTRGGKINGEYELTVDSVDVKTPVEPSRFTLDFLLRQLPPNIILQDNMTLTSKRVNVIAAPVDTSKTLEKLAEPLRGRGFLKPDR